MFHRIFRILKRNMDFFLTGRFGAVVRQARIFRYLLFNRLHGLDISPVSLKELNLSDAVSHTYSNSGGPDLETVLDHQNISVDDSILDIGCGKGGARVTMAKYPFGQVAGLDISKELLEVAQRNIRISKCTTCSLIHADATSFSGYHSYTYYYLANPFAHHLMHQVITSTISSLDQIPRRIKIIYNGPVCHDLIVQSGRFRLTEHYVYSDRDTHVSFNIYSNGSANSPEIIQYPLFDCCTRTCRIRVPVLLCTILF